MSGLSALPVSTPLINPQQCATTQLQILDKLLSQEIELHRFTKSTLAQSQNCCKAWERACISVQSDQSDYDNMSEQAEGEQAEEGSGASTTDVGAALENAAVWPC